MTGMVNDGDSPMKYHLFCSVGSTKTVWSCSRVIAWALIHAILDCWVVSAE